MDCLQHVLGGSPFGNVLDLTLAATGMIAVSMVDQCADQGLAQHHGYCVVASDCTAFDNGP